MAKVGARRYGFMLCFATGVLTGLMIGAAVTSVLACYRVDNYCKQSAYLQSIIEDKNIQLEQLEKSINKGKYILKAIDVAIVSEEDELDIIVFEKEVKKHLDSLLGKEIKTLDIDLITEIIDGRIFLMQGKKYRLELKKLILTETMKLWIEAAVIDNI